MLWDYKENKESEMCRKIDTSYRRVRKDLIRLKGASRFEDVRWLVHHVEWVRKDIEWLGCRCHVEWVRKDVEWQRPHVEWRAHHVECLCIHVEWLAQYVEW